jgi:hypothetical protein
MTSKKGKILCQNLIINLNNRSSNMQAINVRFNVRFNVYQLEHLKMQAKTRGMQAADYVRELIEKEMQGGHFLNYFRMMDDPLTSSNTNPHLIYTLMIYKLMEQLVLNVDEGEQKREEAHQQTLDWLERLKLSPKSKKSCKLNIWVHPETVAWLKEESQLLKKSVAAIIRRIVFFNVAQKAKEAAAAAQMPLTEIQTETLKTVLMTFTLLKSYILDAYDSSEALVENCCESAKTLYKQLYP